VSRRNDLPPRRWRRRTASLDVEYTSSDGGGVARATTRGAGGLFVRVDAAPAEGSPIRVRFRLPDSPLLHELAGRVAWVLSPADAGVHSAGMGIAFSEPHEIASLARALERCAAEAAVESPPA
jgi:Tfp pilus assembly protein PilZ